MVFFYIGPSASSWATGNEQYSMCHNLPDSIQAVWNSIGETFNDKTLAGTRIDWLATAVDGSYCVMLYDGNVLSNRSDVLESIHTARQADPSAVVDHVAFSPYGAYLVRLSSGAVLLSPETSGLFPDAFVGLAADFLHFYGPYRAIPQHTNLEAVFFGASGDPAALGPDAVLVKARGGALRWHGLAPELVSELRALTVGVDMLSVGFELGKRTVLCPWGDGRLYFLEFVSQLGGHVAGPGTHRPRAYPYSLRLHGLHGEAMQYIVLNQRPPPHLLRPGPSVRHPPPPPQQHPSGWSLPGPPPSSPAASATPPVLPPRPSGPPTPAMSWSSTSPPPPPPPSSAYQPMPTPQSTPQTPAPPTVSVTPADEAQLDAFVNSLAMPADIRAMGEQLWQAVTGSAPHSLGVTSAQALQLFTLSGLSAEDLTLIWSKTDLDHNGLLDHDEFLQAVYLVAVQQHLRGLDDQFKLGTRAAAAAELKRNLEGIDSAGGGAVDLTRTTPAYSEGGAPPSVSLRGSVKDVFSLLLEAGKGLKIAYQQAQQQQEQQQQQLQQQHQQQQEAQTSQLSSLQEFHQAILRQAEQEMSQPSTFNNASASPSVGPDTSTAGGENVPDKDTKAHMAAQLQQSLASSIVTDKPNVHWEDVAGLGPAKDEIQEAVVFPQRFPHLFQGARKPRRAILLYGPPGTGKSYLAKAVATEVESTLFSISASDLTSKWFGESEGLVRGLFEMARAHKPSVIFIDEIDALCSDREGGGGNGNSSDGTNARLKTEFLVQMDGVGRGNNDGVVLLAATNLPWSLDPAVRRRFQKRIHIPLPDTAARMQLFRVHGREEWQAAVSQVGASQEQALLSDLARLTEGFSGSDVANTVQDALMMPVKCVRAATHFVQDHTGWWLPCTPNTPGAQPMTWKDVPSGRARAPPLTTDDFYAAVAKVKPSVGVAEIQRCAAWTEQFGLEGA